MVSAAGVEEFNSPVQYASFRKDKDPSPGYSRELISDQVDPKYYDDLGSQPNDLGEGVDTLFKVY